MRLTRAALRAQEGANSQEDGHSVDQVKHSSPVRSSIFIREDSIEGEVAADQDQQISTNEYALKDITHGNYPRACDLVSPEDIVIGQLAKSDMPIAEDKEHVLKELDIDLEQVREQAQDLRNIRGKGQKKKNTRSKGVANGIQESGQDQEASSANLADRDNPSKSHSGTGTVTDITSEPRQPDLFSLSPTKRAQIPRFDPLIHVVETSDQESTIFEDSFIPSITSRSPAKQSVPLSNYTRLTPTTESTTQIPQVDENPVERTFFMPSDVENSIEAMDKFEDDLEQVASQIPPQKELPDSPRKPIVNNRSTPGNLRSAKRSVSNTKITRTPLNSTKGVRQSSEKAESRSSIEGVPIAALQVIKTPKTTRAQQLRISSSRSAKSTCATMSEVEVPSTTQPMLQTPTTTPKLVVHKISSMPARTPAKTTSDIETPVASSRKPSGLKAHIASLRKSTDTGQVSPVAAESSVKDIAAMFETGYTSHKSTPQKITAQLVNVHEDLLEAGDENPEPVEAAQAIDIPTQDDQQQRPESQPKKRSTSTAVLARPAFVPQKSTKPPTTSNFKLPGEVAAEKLRAQKEAREARMATSSKSTIAEQKAAKLRADREAREARVKQNQEKARTASTEERSKPIIPISKKPLSTSIKPSIVPRLNKASEARISRVFSDSSVTSDKENTAPSRSSILPSHIRSKTEAAVIVNKTRSIPAHHNRTSTAMVTPAGSDKENNRPSAPQPKSHNPRVVSQLDPQTVAKLSTMSSGSRLQVSQADIVAQRARGKEMANRPRNELAREKQQQQQLQEAAKKARAEAAERGRQASREWAERMRAKKAASNTVAMGEGTGGGGVMQTA